MLPNKRYSHTILLSQQSAFFASPTDKKHAFLLTAAGLEMSDFQSYVWSMHDNLPVVHGGGCIDAGGTIYNYDGTDYPQWTSEYRLLTYNYLFDYSHRKEAFFHIQE